MPWAQAHRHTIVIGRAGPTILAWIRVAGGSDFTTIATPSSSVSGSETVALESSGRTELTARSAIQTREGAAIEATVEVSVELTPLTKHATRAQTDGHSVFANGTLAAITIVLLTDNRFLAPFSNPLGRIANAMSIRSADTVVLAWLEMAVVGKVVIEMPLAHITNIKTGTNAGSLHFVHEAHATVHARVGLAHFWNFAVVPGVHGILTTNTSKRAILSGNTGTSVHALDIGKSAIGSEFFEDSGRHFTEFVFATGTNPFTDAGT